MCVTESKHFFSYILPSFLALDRNPLPPFLPPSLPYLGVEEDLDEVATGHNELGHQIHVVVAVAP